MVTKTYTRKAYLKKDGTFVRSTKVSYPGGVKSSSKIRIPVKKGSLTKYGYNTRMPKIIRRVALANAIKHAGTSAVIKKLNAVKVFTKNKNPEVSNIYNKDIKWIQKSFY